LEWVADTQPRVVCMENAAELASDTYREYVEWWYSQLDALGYEGAIWLLRAQDYGTPQMRARTFVLAWPKGASWGERLRTPPRATHGHPGSEDVSRGRLLPWIRAFDRLNSGCCGGFGLFTCINLGNAFGSCATCVNGRNYEPAPNQTDAEIRVNLNPTNIKTTIKEKHGAPRIRSSPPVPATVEDAWEALHIDEARLGRYLSPTIRGGARASGPPSGLIEPAGATAWGSVDVWDPASVRAYVEQLQRMSIRDAAKLQDVPQWYKFCGSAIAAYRQIGNGIPVNLGRAVARHIVEALRGGTPAFAPEPMAARNHGLFEGLWPTEFVDPCAPYPGVIGWVEGHSEQAFRTLVLDQEARLARPLVDLQVYEQMRDQRQQIEPYVEHWVDIGGGTPEYIHDFDSTDEPPPGFPDLAYFDQWVQGQDLEIYNHYARLYEWSVLTDAIGRVPIHPASPFYEGYGQDRLHPILHQYRRRVIGQKKGARRDLVDLDAILTRLGL
jgi:site-specific DNA-cytosine methylase